MSTRTPWYCHDCAHIAPSLAAARRHAKEAGPAFRPGGRMVTHKLTQTEPVTCALCECAVTPADGDEFPSIWQDASGSTVCDASGPESDWQAHQAVSAAEVASWGAEVSA